MIIVYIGGWFIEDDDRILAEIATEEVDDLFLTAGEFIAVFSDFSLEVIG